MSFNFNTFITAPSQELLKLAKKTDLLDLAAHYELTGVNKSMLKQEIFKKKKDIWSIFSSPEPKAHR